MEHDSSRSGYHEPEPGLAGREDEEDWGDDFPKTFSVNLIWAQACDKEGHDGAIGFEGGMPWHLPEDMRRFKELTVSHPVIMGRKTFESLPKGALPNRRNIVLSTNPATNFPGAEVFPSLEAALQSCHEKEHVYIIGGETVYRQAIELADELCLTEIDNEAPQADAFFPAIDPQIWHKKSKEVHLADEKHLCSYSFVDYIKEL